MDYKTIILDKLRELALKSGNDGILKIKREEIAQSLNIKANSPKIFESLSQLEYDGAIKIVERGHVAKPYIFEICELANKRSVVNPSEVIELQQQTVAKLLNDREILSTQLHIACGENDSLKFEIERLKQKIERLQYDLTHN